MLKLIVSGVCLCSAVTMAGAQSPGLSGPQISELVAGTTVEIDTPGGTKVPVRYTAEGRLAGDARELAWFLGSPTDIGRWWVAGDQLCHKWIRWFNGEPQCMRLSKEGRVIRWHSRDGNSGTAAITVPAPVQASTLLALPRAFARRTQQDGQAPPALADAPRQREPMHAAPAVDPPLPPAIQDTTADATAPADVTPPATALAAEAVGNAPLKQAETGRASAPLPKEMNSATADAPPPNSWELRTAAVPPPRQAEPANPPASRQAQPKPSDSPRFMVTNVRQDDVLNVRSGPSADFDIVAELPPGSRGIAITSECRARWCPVQHESASGWVNSAYLAPDRQATADLQSPLPGTPGERGARPPPGPVSRDSPEAPRSCLTPAARALLGRIEQNFGPVRVVSTCRPGAVIAGTHHPSRHASGNAVDFDAGTRKAQIVEWLIANHRAGGVMTYSGMDHIHVDIGPHFVSIAGGRHLSSWSRTRRDSGDD